MTTLNYAYEIKHLDLLDELKPPAKLEKQELQLAEMLMKKLYKKKFDISHFKDTFATKLAHYHLWMHYGHRSSSMRNLGLNEEFGDSMIGML